MQSVTLLIAISGFILAFSLKPMQGLFIYLAGLFWYSQYLVVSIGTVDFTVTKIIILGLLANIFFRTRLVHEFKWNLMDTLIMLFIIGRFIALTISGNVPARAFVEREGSFLFNAILPYFAVRFIINSKEHLLAFFKGLILIAVPLAILGMYEFFTGNNPVGFMTKYFAWGHAVAERVSSQRLGFYRAKVTFYVPITFGLFFAGLTPLCIGLWKQEIWKKPTNIVLFALMLSGILSSMSSAPYFSIAASLTILALYKFRRFWGAIFIVLFVISFIIFVQVYSNQPFHEYLTRFAFSSENAYYRINLVKEAFSGGMKDNWLAGYGYVGFGLGAYENIDFNWEHTDFVNLYIGLLVQYGLLGLLPFLGINILYFRRLFQAAKLTSNQADLWFIWCFLSTLIGWNVAMMTVSALNQVNTLLYILIAICCNMPYIMMTNRLSKQPIREQPLSTVNTLTAS